VVEEDSGDADEPPVEEFIPHQAGLDGLGGSSYIDDVILRDRDTDGNGSLDERRYYCQNWRHDVSAIVTDTGKMIEWGKSTAYGIPDGLPAGDSDSDGDWDATDSAAISAIGGGYVLLEDAELDGDVDANDITHANSITGGYQTLGFNVLSSTGVKNRKGYAGYERDHAALVLWHVRYRVLHTTLGRWTRRDPLGYVDGGNDYVYARSIPLSLIDTLGLSATSVTRCYMPDCERIVPDSLRFSWRNSVVTPGAITGGGCCNITGPGGFAVPLGTPVDRVTPTITASCLQQPTFPLDLARSGIRSKCYGPPGVQCACEFDNETYGGTRTVYLPCNTTITLPYRCTDLVWRLVGPLPMRRATIRACTQTITVSGFLSLLVEMGGRCVEQSDGPSRSWPPAHPGITALPFPAIGAPL
jgi:RHS repeat-associated protein